MDKKLRLVLFAIMFHVWAVAVYAGEVAAEAVTSPWMPVIGDVIQLLVQILQPFFVILASWAAWKLASKLGIEKNGAMDAMLRKYVKEAINWVDAWAESISNKEVTGEDKKAAAMRYLIKLIEDSPLPRIAEERLSAMIEAQLKYDEKVLSNGSTTSNVINE